MRIPSREKAQFSPALGIRNRDAKEVYCKWQIRTFLESNPRIERSGRYSFTLDGRPVDFNQAMPLPAHPHGLDALGNGLMGWLANRGWALRLFYWLGKKELLQKVKENL